MRKLKALNLGLNWVLPKLGVGKGKNPVFLVPKGVSVKFLRFLHPLKRFINPKEHPQTVLRFPGFWLKNVEPVGERLFASPKPFKKVCCWETQC